MTAFKRLNSCRQMGMVVGPIPWDRIVEYALREGLDPDFIDTFVAIIEEMDQSYLDWVEKRRTA